MGELAEKTISSNQLFTGKLLKLRIDAVELPNGVQATREVVEHPGAVAVVALTEKDELVLVRQFRQAVGQVLLELPAGVPHQGESIIAAAKRELAEETGYQAKSVSQIWSAYSSPGYSNEIIHYCLAKELAPVAANADEDELVEVDHVPLKQCLAWLKEGKINDGKTIIGIYLALLHCHARTI
ncbi:hypothetical protein A2311_02290 [candidate division WOR-1 bacterium RIFOXYB2_FULL_48_7]|uniref:Nudix hydrolase domain-containing protein n=1 Tax=candidate division WOR-1 bacterium RIFOXYB2_FULL_48_7 TaxID=1802583 RepID=A0A1F4TLR0_UNCSA|nr:MAG: hypothetical protein A2311_02290 [candidate division WOR-1 bacterium RIFOXYB2_FULL_48_7]